MDLSEHEFRDLVFAELNSCDVSKTSLKSLKKILEERLNCDLKEKKDLIRDCLNQYVNEYEESNDDKPTTVTTPSEDSNGNNDGHTVKKKSSESSKRSGGGFAKLVQLSDELTEFFNGVFEMQRTEVTKQMWVYIKAHDLQNPNNKREILCDEKLEKLFKRKKVDMFKMTKLLSGMMKNYAELQAAAPIEHIAAGLEEHNKKKRKRARTEVAKKKNNESSSSSSKKKKAAAVKEEDDAHDEDGQGDDIEGEDEIQSTKKQRKANNSIKKESSQVKGENEDGEKKKKKASGGLSKPMVVSEALKNVLKCDTLSPRTEVVSKLWAYIREKDLQNPANKRQVFLDAPLKKAFNVDTCTIFSINKLLSPHLTPP